jgi:hypothetical protein
LLPNPAAPQTDANDEFIELHNPNDTVFDLNGYILEVGTTTKRRYTFPVGALLQAKTYQAFFSSETGLSLSNSGGQARLIDPQGVILAETDIYGTAKDGQAWALANGIWQWSATPTPNALNTVTAVVATTAKKTKAASTKKKAQTKSTAAKKPKKAVKQNESQQVLAATTDTPSGPVHPGVLALVGGFALLYGAYEYRHDLANRFRNFRANRATRGAARQGAKGR